MITLPTRAWGGDLVCDKVFSLGLGVSPGECTGALLRATGAPGAPVATGRGDTTRSEAVYDLNLFKLRLACNKH